MLNGNRLVSRSFKTLLVAAGVVAAIAATSGNAFADPLSPFTIDPQVLAALNPMGGMYPGATIVDRADGNYSERIIFTGPNTFMTIAFMNFTGYDLNGAPVDGANTGLAQTTGYNMYALFAASGTFETTGTVTTFTATSGSATLYADPRNGVTTFDTSNTATFANRTNFADDRILATAPLISGSGRVDSQIAQSGSFGLLFDPVTLSMLGSQYFIAPNPFYIEASLNGVFDPFSIGTTTVTSGSGNLFFNPSPAAVPEPASLTLLGLGLVGVARRRFAKSK